MLASAVQQSLIQVTGRKNRGIKQADFAVLRIPICQLFW
nr:hypothetical protein [Planococcus faecalis]